MLTDMTQRIGTAATLPLHEIQTFHKNPRRGNVPAIQESIVKNGQFKPLIVNAGTHTGRKNEVLAGNHTLLAMRELAGTEHALTDVDVYLVDVTDEEANRIVLADNRTSDLGTYDQHDLVALLTDLDHDLDGTGYDYDDLDDLSALLEEIPAPRDHEPGTHELRDGDPDDDEDDEDEDEDRPAGLLNNSADSDNAEKYADRATRMFVLAFPIEQYTWVSNALEQVAEDHDLDTNSDVLLHLLSDYTGEAHPTLPTADETNADEEENK